MIAAEEATQLRASAIPAMPDQRNTSLGGIRSDRLQSSQPLARQRTHPRCNIGVGCDKRIILWRVHAHHTRGFHSAIAARKRRAQGERNLAENRSGDAPPEPALDAVDQLDDLDLA